MSVKIRLARFGKKFAPSYKIVAANTRDKRNGRFLDIIGYFNPSEGEQKLDIDKKAYEKWVGNGAQVTDAVTHLIEGNYDYKPYNGKKADSSVEKAPEPEATPVTDKEEQKPDSKDQIEEKSEDINEDSK